MAVLTSSPKNSLPSTRIFLISSPWASTVPSAPIITPGILASRVSVSASEATLKAAALYTTVSPFCEVRMAGTSSTTASMAVDSTSSFRVPRSTLAPLTATVFTSSL